MNQTQHHAVPSLLWPDGHDRVAQSQGLSYQQALDLGLDLLVRELDWDGRQAAHVRSILTALVADRTVIAYRQAVLSELSTNTGLRNALAALLPSIVELSLPRSAAWAQDSPLLLVPPRLSDLELYVACVTDVLAALHASDDVQSAGLVALRDYLAATQADAQFQALAAELPGLRAQLDQVASVTVGVNLDRDLRPLSATLVALNREPFTGPRSITSRLFGRVNAAGLGSMTALRHVAERNPDIDPLARDLEKVLAEVVQPVATGLERYQRIHARPLAALAPELAFYFGAVQFAERLASHNLPTCLPAITATDHVLVDAYNPALALQLARAQAGNGATPNEIVANPIDFAQGRIVFLTGPNRGGKTTYLRAVGLNQVLFQAGICVAAGSARMGAVDALLTHFPPLEGTEPGHGRLDDEARRLREIFSTATPESLLLFNEPLTSTSEREAHGLAADVLRALQLLGARTIFVTHLHALAAEIPALNEAKANASIVSWVAGVTNDSQRTYSIRPGLPITRSHAASIAEQHGITFTQLAENLRLRRVIGRGDSPTQDTSNSTYGD